MRQRKCFVCGKTGEDVLPYVVSNYNGVMNGTYSLCHKHANHEIKCGNRLRVKL